MHESVPAITVEEMYADLGMSDEEYAAIVDRSLNPRDRDTLYDKMGHLGLNSMHRVLDIGCYDAGHSLELARRFGCEAIAVEPVPKNLELARKRVSESEQAHLVQVMQGRIEAIPMPDRYFDFIWSRDMLNHVADLRTAFGECVRVLKPDGKMLLHNTFATELLEEREAARLFPPLAVVPKTTIEANVEQEWQMAGLRMVDREVIGGEWREKWEEDGTRYTSHQLLRISRLLRDKDRKIAQLGPKVYANELADCTWGVYHLLSKLSPIVYVLVKA